jgi:hypothetical protein
MNKEVFLLLEDEALMFDDFRLDIIKSSPQFV